MIVRAIVGMLLGIVKGSKDLILAGKLKVVESMARVALIRETFRR